MRMEKRKSLPLRLTACRPYSVTALNSFQPVPAFVPMLFSRKLLISDILSRHQKPYRQSTSLNLGNRLAINVRTSRGNNVIRYNSGNPNRTLDVNDRRWSDEPERDAQLGGGI
jgi:hypothetical protein